MTDQELQAIRERCEKATPGPWVYSNRNGPVEIYAGENEEEVCDDADGDFICHARANVPALLAEIDRLRAELEKYKGFEVAWDATVRQLRGGEV